MSDVPEKWRISCPLDHSSFEKFVNCDCNYGNARDVWWFKEQQLEKLQEKNKILKDALEFYSVSGKYHYGEYRKNGEWSFNPPSISDDCGETAREALAKVTE